jgi:hypothetical protein
VQSPSTSSSFGVIRSLVGEENKASKKQKVIAMTQTFMPSLPQPLVSTNFLTANAANLLCTSVLTPKMISITAAPITMQASIGSDTTPITAQTCNISSSSKGTVSAMTSSPKPLSGVSRPLMMSQLGNGLFTSSQETSTSRSVVVDASSTASLSSSSSVSAHLPTSSATSTETKGGQQASKNSTERSKATDSKTVLAHVETKSKEIIELIEQDLKKLSLVEQGKMLEQLVEELHDLQEALESSSELKAISTALYNHFKSRITEEKLNKIENSFYSISLSEMKLLPMYLPEVFTSISITPAVSHEIS